MLCVLRVGPPNGAFYPGQARPGGPTTNHIAGGGPSGGGPPAPRGYGSVSNAPMQPGYSSGPPTQFGGA
ncbi:MAG: hypothetical protein ABGY24_17175, partial [bacterium]